MSKLTVLLYLLLRYRHPELNGVYNFGTVLGRDQRLKKFRGVKALCCHQHMLPVRHQRLWVQIG